MMEDDVDVDVSARTGNSAIAYIGADQIWRRSWCWGKAVRAGVDADRCLGAWCGVEANAGAQAQRKCQAKDGEAG